jgi:hypothetical protein
MAEWSDAANNLMLFATKHFWRAVLLIVLVAACGIYYLKHKTDESKISVQTTGTQGQTAGTNNGTMLQENK